MGGRRGGGGGGERDVGDIRGRKNFVGDIREKGMCVCVWGGGGGGRERIWRHFHLSLARKCIHNNK